MLKPFTNFGQLDEKYKFLTVSLALGGLILHTNRADSIGFRRQFAHFPSLCLYFYNSNWNITDVQNLTPFDTVFFFSSLLVLFCITHEATNQLEFQVWMRKKKIIEMEMECSKCITY